MNLKIVICIAFIGIVSIQAVENVGNQENAEGVTAEGKYKTVLVFSLYIVSIQPVEQ